MSKRRSDFIWDERKRKGDKVIEGVRAKEYTKIKEIVFLHSQMLPEVEDE